MSIRPIRPFLYHQHMLAVKEREPIFGPKWLILNPIFRSKALYLKTFHLVISSLDLTSSLLQIQSIRHSLLCLCLEDLLFCAETRSLRPDNFQFIFFWISI
jgi:hypothetical protein